MVWSFIRKRLNAFLNLENIIFGIRANCFQLNCSGEDIYFYFFFILFMQRNSIKVNIILFNNIHYKNSIIQEYFIRFSSDNIGYNYYTFGLFGL